jgi:hypothetical protein
LILLSINDSRIPFLDILKIFLTHRIEKELLLEISIIEILIECVNEFLSIITYANLILLVLTNAFKRYTYMLSNLGGVNDFLKKLKFTFNIVKFIQW